MTSVSRSRLEQELHTTLTQLLESERETSALTDALDQALRRDPQAQLIVARILDAYCGSAVPNARAQALRQYIDRAFPSGANDDSSRAQRLAAGLRASAPPNAAPSDANDGDGSLSDTMLEGRFVLNRPLGRGATGVVYRAYDRRPGLHPAQIAVKVLHEELQREQVTLARVRHDFAVSQSLEHPNIVKVFDFYRDEHCNFYTMELVDGESLRRLMDLLGPEPMSLEEVSPLIRDMGAALAHAHRRDVVHGDFKPENVVVTRNLAAKVLDFGLARAAHAVHRRLGAQVEREVTLTPAYASSEVLEGSDPDAIDDVYSYACVCYELLAGHLPFGALNALAARDAGLAPVRIEGLSDAQWGALSCALALRAPERTIGVEELMSRLCSGGRASPASAPAPVPLPQPESRRVAQSGQRSRGSHAHARSRRPHGSRPWLAAALVAGIALALGVVYGAFRETRLSEITATAASRAAEPAPSPTVAPPAERTDATAQAVRSEPAAPATTDSGMTVPPATPGVLAATAPVEEGATAGASTSSTPAATASDAASAPASAPTPASAPPAGAAQPAAAAAPGGFAFTAPRYAMSESRSLISIPIERRGGRGPATVVWWTVEGAARAYDDYAYLGRRTEEFADGETTRYIQIPVVSDQLAEGDEDFYVELASPGAGADADALTRAEIVIRDDDY